jgi:hypothetical protein
MTPLRRRMTEDMQVRNFSPHTQDSYVQQVSLFARHFSKSPEVLGREEIRSYQVYLTNEKKLAPSSILIAVSALRFLYKVTLHRHCPKCQSFARFKWLEQRQAELLNAQYFHLVFTLPQQIAAIAYQNKRQLYGILFRATAQTLLTIATDPKHLGAEIGFFAVLHTWGQNLLHHPHLHCVVTGGGLSADGSQWISCRDGFFLPVVVLSRLFRRLFLEYLLKAFDAGKLQFFSSLESLRDRCSVLDYLAPLREAEWVVYAKKPFAGPEQVLDYVGLCPPTCEFGNYLAWPCQNSRCVSWLRFPAPRAWRREDGSIATTQLATLARAACRSAEDVGLQLADAKPMLGRLQEIAVSELDAPGSLAS